MQYFIVSWWKIVIFYLGCLKCFTWDGQQTETAVFWGPARPKKAPQIWWKTQDSYFFSLFLGMCEYAFSVSFYLCGKVGTCSFLQMCWQLSSNPTFDWAGIFHKNSWWPVLDKGWSDLQRHWKHLRKCVSSGCTRGGLTQIHLFHLKPGLFRLGQRWQVYLIVRAACVHLVFSFLELLCFPYSVFTWYSHW